jgi:hypothetical protein
MHHWAKGEIQYTTRRHPAILRVGFNSANTMISIFAFRGDNSEKRIGEDRSHSIYVTLLLFPFILDDTQGIDQTSLSPSLRARIRACLIVFGR